ncbi:MAG: DinB family protein [Balneolales bacterium]|nr:DinB family protein [Balneolales bacterium]
MELNTQNYWLEDIERCKLEVRKLATGLSNEQFNWKPSAKSWSIAECVSHLNIIGSKMCPLIEKAVEKALESGESGQPPYKAGWLAAFFSEWFRARRQTHPGS